MTFGFIIVRNVQSQQTNRYWNECVTCIRKFYSDPIYIVDTGSNYEQLFPHHSASDVFEVKADRPNRAMLNAYLFLLETRLLSSAVILQDSVFLKKKLKLTNTPVQFLWDFQLAYNNPATEIPLLYTLENGQSLVNLYSTPNWRGCFGSMTFITLSALDTVEKKYKFSRLKEHIQSWNGWMAFERVLAILCWATFPELAEKPSLLGDIHKYSIPYGFTWDQYIQKQYSPLAPLVKVYSTRKES
jgi:hypothetical protein